MKLQQQAYQIRKRWIDINRTKKEEIEKQVGPITTKKALIEEYSRQIKLSKQRNENKPKTDILILAKNNRLNKVKDKYLSFAVFAGNYYDRDSGDMRRVYQYDGKRRMALIGVDDWVQYTKRYGTYVHMRGLVLFDEDSETYRFLRVGPKVRSINEALDYIKPAVVKKAEDEGKYVIRQGDVYFVPSRTWNMKNIIRTNHHVKIQEDGSCIIDHNTHNPVILRTPHKAYRQMIVQNTHFKNGGGRAAGHAD